MTTPLLTPGERLTLSRERLRQAMGRSSGRGEAGSADGKHSSAHGIVEMLKLSMPNAGLVIDAIAQWWAGHPLQSKGNMAEGIADELLRPLAKRNPIALVAGAVAVGALVAWMRPWRWALKPNVLHTWGPALLSSAIASSAVQGWLLATLAKSNTPPQPTPPSQEQPAAPRDAL